MGTDLGARPTQRLDRQLTQVTLKDGRVLGNGPGRGGAQ